MLFILIFIKKFEQKPFQTKTKYCNKNEKKKQSTKKTRAKKIFLKYKLKVNRANKLLTLAREAKYLN